MNQIFRYMLNMVPYMLIALPIFVFIRLGLNFYRQDKTKKINIFREITLLIFALYIVGLASQTIIPRFEFGANGFGIVGAYQNRYNIIPFLVFKETYQAIFNDNYFNYFVINFIGNILLFIPFGFFLPLLWIKMRKLHKTIILGFLLSLTIEIIQFPLFRGTDIDDLWLNTLGVLIGYYIFRILLITISTWQVRDSN